MSSAVIYYGAPTKAGQVVSEEVRSRGINLLRSSPSESYPEVIRVFNTPQYVNYINNLGAAFEAAVRNVYIHPKDSTHYWVPSRTTTPPFMRTPTIVWNYTRQVAPDSLSQIRDRFEASETVAQGKPALVSPLSLRQVQDLVKDTSPNDKTPSSTTTINIDSYRAYVKLNQLADLFLRVHQYPLLAAEDDEDQTSYFRNSLMLPMEDVESSTTTLKPTNAAEYKVYNFHNFAKIRFNMNLASRDLDNFKYTITTAAEATSESNLLFPFLSSLARPDNDMVIETIRRYFMPLLGSDDDEAMFMLQFLKSAWGCLKITLWGDELAHLFSGIRLCLDTGAAMKVITTPNNIYQGFVLIGAGYRLIQHGLEFSPVRNSQFAAAFNKASPHLSSLSSLCDMINFVDDMQRQAEKDHFTKNSQVAAALRKYGYNSNNEERIKQLACNLVFPSDQSLPLTAVNVTSVLTAMHSAVTEESFPLHHYAILEKDRRRRLLSAFGALCPSFVIPGGRPVSLEGTFEYNVMIKGKKESRTTTRMFAMAVPWEKACQDLDKVLIDRNVYTPIGTPLANRASSFSLIREFSGPGGAGILGALRMLAGVSLISSITAVEGKKRKGDDNDNGEGPSMKKLHLSVGF